MCDINSVRHREMLNKLTGGLKIYLNYRSERFRNRSSVVKIGGVRSFRRRTVGSCNLEDLWADDGIILKWIL